jgi:RNA polymerase sigma-70 factor (ECF subfamily)
VVRRPPPSRAGRIWTPSCSERAVAKQSEPATGPASAAERRGNPPDSLPFSPDTGLTRRITAALDALPRGQRDAFVLVHMEGFSVTEAAAVLGSAPGTIKSHLHRALTRLRADLEDLDDAGVKGK